jgi:hypothetical protein
MQDRPTSRELLEAVRAFLETDVVPSLDGPKRFHARVAANLLSIVSRELDLEAEQLAAEWARLDSLLGEEPMPSRASEIKEVLRKRSESLCDRIRAGDADEGTFRNHVIDHVRQSVVEKLQIANPKLVP